MGVHEQQEADGNSQSGTTNDLNRPITIRDIIDRERQRLAESCDGTYRFWGMTERTNQISVRYLHHCQGLEKITIKPKWSHDWVQLSHNSHAMKSFQTHLICIEWIFDIKIEGTIRLDCVWFLLPCMMTMDITIAFGQNSDCRRLHNGQEHAIQQRVSDINIPARSFAAGNIKQYLPHP
jgi:hypothetical protein